MGKAYQTLSALMNYKRTVSDLAKCGDRVGNPYNFPFISECVKSEDFKGPCQDPAAPVPCGDGTCKSDYITCLRALTDATEAAERAAQARGGQEQAGAAGRGRPRAEGRWSDPERPKVALKLAAAP